MIERIIDSERFTDSDKKRFLSGACAVDSVLDDFEPDMEMSELYKGIKVIDLIKVIEDLPDKDLFIVKLDDYNRLIEGCNDIIAALDKEEIYNERLECFSNNMKLSDFLYALNWHMGQAC